MTKKAVQNVRVPMLKRLVLKEVQLLQLEELLQGDYKDTYAKTVRRASPGR